MVTIWTPDLSVYKGPRYLAIADALGDAIKEQRLQVGERLPTHRALADTLGVTVGTITRAYAEAERRGLVEARVGSGTFVKVQGQLLAQPWKIQTRREGWANLGVNICVPDDRETPFRQAMERVLAGNVNALMEHNQEAGLPEHRQQYLPWLAMIGLYPELEQLFMTSGGQQGIMLSLLACTRPGDIIVAEALTYPGLLLTARKLALTVIPVSMDEEGPTPESLERAFRERRPKAFYCSPTLQNPTTRTLSHERRLALLDLCERYNVWVIEDDITGWIPSERPVPMAAMMPERVLHIGGVSKAVAGGIRVGSLVVPTSLISTMQEVVRAVCWMTSPLLTAIVGQWIEMGEATRLLERQRDALRHRTALVREYLAEFGVETALESSHAWLALPDPWMSHDFVQQANALKVQIYGSEHFCVGRQVMTQGIRIALSHPATLAELEVGLERLRSLLRAGPAPAPAVR